jgi:uncharacterized protein YegP (UPF0339 family)
MAGKFEVFLDSDSLFRFRLKAPDGAVMAVSGAFRDKSAVAAGIAAVRECAGMGLVTDLSAGPRDQHAPAHAPVLSAQSAAAPAASAPAASAPAATVAAASLSSAAAEPACAEQPVPVSRVRAIAHFNTIREGVSGARWSGAV